jgi:LmbE family N-acetylglucosaminyl deacetylase
VTGYDVGGRDLTGPGTTEQRWRSSGLLAALPHHAPEELRPAGRVVVVAPHPDDETLGAGGLMAEANRRRIPIHVVMVTDGGAAGDAEVRSRELRAAVTSLAPRARITELAFADGQTREHRPEIVTALRRILATVPREHSLVAAPWRDDGHRDHRIVGEVVAESLSASA